MNCYGIVQGLPWDCQKFGELWPLGLPRDYLLPWGCPGLLSVVLCPCSFKAKLLFFRCDLTLLRFIFAQRDCHWITLGLRRDCQRIALGMLSDWRIAVGLPLDCLWVCLWDWRKMGIAKGLPTVCQWNTLGLCRDCLGIAKILPGCDLGIDKGLPYLWTRLLPAPPWPATQYKTNY